MQDLISFGSLESMLFWYTFLIHTITRCLLVRIIKKITMPKHWPELCCWLLKHVALITASPCWFYIHIKLKQLKSLWKQIPKTGLWCFQSTVLFRRNACPENIRLPPEMEGTIIIHPTVSAEPQDSLQMGRCAIDSRRKHLERKNKIRLSCFQRAIVLHLEMH